MTCTSKYLFMTPTSRKNSIFVEFTLPANKRFSSTTRKCRIQITTSTVNERCKTLLNGDTVDENRVPGHNYTRKTVCRMVSLWKRPVQGAVVPVIDPFFLCRMSILIVCFSIHLIRSRWKWHVRVHGIGRLALARFMLVTNGFQ